MPDLELGFQIHLVIVLCSQTVARLGSVLTHHDDGRLHRGETRQNQIQQNKWIRIECSGSEQHGVRTDPDKDNGAKCNEKFPTAAKLGNVIGKSLAESKLLFELLADVGGQNLVLLQALNDLIVERGKFADLIFQDFLDII